MPFDAFPAPAAEATCHLVLPFAACESAPWWSTLQALPDASTTHLRALQADLQPQARDDGEPRTLTPPHERLLARELGWRAGDGLHPWAAWQAREKGLAATGAWGWVTLCHWAMGREHATLSDPAALQVQAAESDALLAAMRPFFESDGIRLHPQAPGLWLAEGEPMAVPTASLDRALGRNVDPWLPSSSQARGLRRLQNEMQMLLYTHPVNEARQAARQLAINSVWFSGTGVFEPGLPLSGVSLDRTLAMAALAEDWPGYAQAWATLDAGPVRALRAQQAAGQAVRLSLCGERGSLTLETAPRSLGARLARWWRRPAWPQVLEGL